MLFTICFIYNLKDIKGAVLQRSHTKHPSEGSGNRKIYGNKPYNRVKQKITKNTTRQNTPKGTDTQVGNVSDAFHLKKLVLQFYLQKGTGLC